MKRSVERFVCRLLVMLPLLLLFPRPVVAEEEAAGDGWRFQNGVLTVTTDDGLADFIDYNGGSISIIRWGSAPMEALLQAKRIVFASGVREVHLLQGGIPSMYNDPLRSLSFADTVEKIIFNQWRPFVEKIVVDSGNDHYYVQNGILIERESMTACMFEYGRTYAAVPAGVKTIGRNCFYGHTALKTLILPEGLENIEKWAFADCENLRKIDLPESLRWIEEYAFADCIRLNYLVFPPQVQFRLPEGDTGLLSMTGAQVVVISSCKTVMDRFVFTSRYDPCYPKALVFLDKLP